MPLEVSSGCGSSSIGDTECVLLQPYYSVYQWATCLTDDYIMRSSDGDHHCRSGRGTICWYQCQIELHNFDSGPVYDDCRCSVGSTTPSLPPNEVMPTLAPYCFSPGGIDCSWYRECLEARYSCEGTADGYAIEYAERYCNLYLDNYNDFSPSGRLWIDGVRKCLQVALVPTLRPWVRKTCADISNDAFNSHPTCYVTPGSGAPSICSLSCADIWRTFYVVNVIGDALTSEPLKTGKQMLEVMGRCFINGGDCVNKFVTTVSFIIPGIRIIRSFPLVVTRVSQFIARSLNFKENGIGWFPNFNANVTNSRQRRNVMTPDIDNVMLLLIDLKLLNTSNGTSSNLGGRQTLSEAIITFRDAVNNGLLSRIPVMLNDTEVILGISSLEQCGDAFCSNNTSTTLLATAPPPTDNGALKLGPSPGNLFNSAICILISSYLFRVLHA